jgi:hypothetical protein
VLVIERPPVKTKGPVLYDIKELSKLISWANNNSEYKGFNVV